LRLGNRTRTLWTSTLKPTPFIRNLLKMPKSLIVQGSTYENRANLAPDFFESVGQYEGTSIGRQELYGELIDPGENGFVKKSQWKLWPAAKPLPEFKFVIYSLDTAFTEKDFDKKEQENDPTGCSIWGVFEMDGKCNVLLLDCWQEWLGFPELIKRVKTERLQRFGAPGSPLVEGSEPLYGRPLVGKFREQQGRAIDVVLIENKGSGISLRQALAVEDVLTEEYNPGKADKLTRLHTVSPMFPHGRVWGVESTKRSGEFRDWAEPLIDQVCSYVGEGSLEHDDLLDSATQALKYVADRFMGAFTKPPPTKAQLLQEAIESRPRPMRNSYYG
jgi:phage terminase large subunit-like protein